MDETKKIKVYMGIPTTGTVVDSQAYILRDLAETYSDYIEIVYPDSCVRRMFHDHARNAIVDDFLATDCDILWFLDSDITPSAQFFDLIVHHGDKWQAAGSTYPVFMSTPGSKQLEVVFTVYLKNEKTGNLALGPAPKEGIGFVDGLATGCLLIKREVFDLLKKPYFEFRFKDNRDILEGEDLGFARKLNEQGIQFFTDFSIIGKHQKTVDLLDVNNYAISYSNRNILEFDRQIKAQIKEALTAAYQQGYQKALAETKPKSNVLWTPN